MGKGRRMPPKVTRLHTPERALWTPEAAELYLDDNGYLSMDEHGKPRFALRPVPILSDEYPVVDVAALAEDISSLFVSGAFADIYEKRRIYVDHVDGMDVTTVVVLPVPLPDNVDHVQGLENYMQNGRKVDQLGYAFCDSPDRQMEIAQQPHMVKTEIYDRPAAVPPELQRNHMTSHRACLDLYKAAIVSVNRGYGYVNRAEAIKSGSTVPKIYNEARLNEIRNSESYADIIDEQTVRYFRGHNKDYRKAVDLSKKALEKCVARMPEASPFFAAGTEALEARPARIVNILSKVATDRPWGYADFIRGKIDLQTAQNTHKNGMERRVTREAMLRIGK